jgi:DNA-binding transcriptional LysR family regulator
MIAVPFGDRQRFAVVGSPAYFADHRKPRTPADLKTHRCIRSRMPSGAIYHWEFERHGEVMRFDGDGALTLDDAGLMLKAARAGLGLAYLTEWNVDADVRAGTLVRVLEDWTPPLDGLSLLSQPSPCFGRDARAGGTDPRICRCTTQTPGARGSAIRKRASKARKS